MEFCTVATASGQVRGLIGSGVMQFKGVPYGASTGGTNRFQRPRPPTPWTGARDCFGYGQVSPQVPYDVSHEYARLIQFDLNVALGGMGEDCLHLNIWTPGTGRQDKRAVLFCIHGGGFAICSGNHPVYDGAKLASLGDVVVVTVTHRLSSFGYLDLADVDPSGRWADAGAGGMLDLIAALEWVRDNIEAFGGGPGNVTIMGESGGGAKVSTLLAMPAAKGLFHRAVIQSGPGLRGAPKDIATRTAKGVLDELHVDTGNLKTLQGIPAEDILDAAFAAAAKAGGGPMGAMMRLAPVVDGVVLLSDPFTPVAPKISATSPS